MKNNLIARIALFALVTGFTLVQAQSIRPPNIDHLAREGMTINDCPHAVEFPIRTPLPP